MRRVDARWWQTAVNIVAAVGLSGPAIVMSGLLVRFAYPSASAPLAEWTRWLVVWIQYGLAACGCLCLPYLVLRQTNAVIAASNFAALKIGQR